MFRSIFTVEEKFLMLLMILNIESSTEICSVCLSAGDGIVCAEETAEPNRHSEWLTVMIQQCLQNAGVSLRELKAVAISEGPGSYTSLRVGASVAKGICYALDIPMIAVDTLESLAVAALAAEPGADLYYPMIDARRMEVYTAPFDNAGRKIGRTSALVIDENSFKDEFEADKRVVFCGNGAPKTREAISNKQAVFLEIRCSARHLASLSNNKYSASEFIRPDTFEPFYFKSPNITVSRQLL